MNLYLIRHGQSVPNFEKRHSGWSMLPLTERGFEDARRAGKALEGRHFDRVYSSDLTRAVQTARTALPDCEPMQLSLIRERGVGSLTEKYIEDCFAQLGEAYLTARATRDFSPFGGESADEVSRRAAEFLHMLESDPAENIAAFTHGVFISYILEQVLGASIEPSRFAIPNGAILHLFHDGNHWRLCF